MSVHVAEPPIADADAWPTVEIKRQPNGKLGVALAFPVPEILRARLEVDEFVMNMEPQRAKRLRDELAAHLKELGFE